MFEEFGSCELAVFGDMTDDDHGHTLALGVADELRADGPNLGDIAWEALVGLAEDRLNRVDDERGGGGVDRTGGGEDRFDRGTPAARRRAARPEI